MRKIELSLTKIQKEINRSLELKLNVTQLALNLGFASYSTMMRAFANDGYRITHKRGSKPPFVVEKLEPKKNTKK